MDAVDAVVVGGGIAGLSAAHALIRAGAGRVCLIEREPIPCAHSSGRNAAIFRHLSSTPGDVELARRSRVLLTELLGRESAWLHRTGMWFLADSPAEIDALAKLAIREGITHIAASGAALDAALPSLAVARERHGLFCEDDGVIDIHAVTQALARAITSEGGLFTLGTEVARIDTEHGRVTAVRLASGDRIPTGVVVIAAGAWGRELGASAGAPMPLEPRRRHLAQLDTRALPSGSPVVWCLGDEVYFRPESGGVLASPCDEMAWKAEVPPPDTAAIELLAVKLSRAAPRLADAAVRSAWACLRTFAPDRASVVGPDPRVAGLHWLGGLGGHGMTGGVAAGEVVAACVTGRAHPLSAVLDPARCLA